MQPTLVYCGLRENDFMRIYQAGELASLEGHSVLACDYLDDQQRLFVWMLGYMEEPIIGIEPDNVADTDPASRACGQP